MMGYYCTLFAYGQTGTGKPFTMEGGEMRNEGGISWDSDSTSDIIPRALAQMFNTLQEQADTLEYSVRVSFIELYKEEIFDLLSVQDDVSRLRLYEDAGDRRPRLSLLSPMSSPNINQILINEKKKSLAQPVRAGSQCITVNPACTVRVWATS